MCKAATRGGNKTGGWRRVKVGKGWLVGKGGG